MDFVGFPERTKPVRHHPLSERMSRPSPAEESLWHTSVSMLFSRHGYLAQVRQGGILCLHGEPAETLLLVISGTVRCCTIAEDGRRHIFRFAQAGDLIGLSEVDIWHFTAEAVTDLRLRAVSREAVQALAANDPGLRQALSRRLLGELRCRENLLMSFAHQNAEERLLDFLRRFSREAPPELRAEDQLVTLPMPRRDLGDHLGLTFETVSRAFSALKRRAAIEMRGTDRFRVLSAQL